MSILTFTGCNNVQSDIDRAFASLDRVEDPSRGLTNSDLKSLETQIADLDNQISEHREEFSEDQIKQVGRIKGRFAAVTIKKGLNDAKETLKDWDNQIHGFFEGISGTERHPNANYDK